MKIVKKYLDSKDFEQIYETQFDVIVKDCIKAIEKNNKENNYVFNAQQAKEVKKYFEIKGIGVKCRDDDGIIYISKVKG